MWDIGCPLGPVHYGHIVYKFTRPSPDLAPWGMGGDQQAPMASQAHTTLSNAPTHASTFFNLNEYSPNYSV